MSRKRRRTGDDFDDQLYSYSPEFMKYELSQNKNIGNSCDVPITFRHLSELVDVMLVQFTNDTQTNVLTDKNILIYKKVCFILAEIKLARSAGFGRYRHLRNIVFDGHFQNYSFRDMSVPYPIAFYLNSIGRFTNQEKNYVPVPAITENHITDACYSCMPYMFINVLNQLANGVEIEKVPEKARRSLKSLPAIDWEIITNDAGVETHIRLATKSTDFWLKPLPENASEGQLRDLNCTFDDFNIFSNINHFIACRCSREVMADFTKDDEGNASQLVRFDEYRSSLRGVHDWYTMHNVRNIYKKLGIAFGFGNFEEKIQESIAIGDFRTAHTTGQNSVYWDLLHKLVEPIWHRGWLLDSD